MRYVLVLIILLMAVPAWGQPVPPPIQEIDSCQFVAWKASPEPDLDGYKMYVNRDGTDLAPIDIPETQTQIPCVDAHIVPVGLYTVGLTAYDTSGNESLPAEVTFNYVLPDTTPPSTPTELCLRLTLDGVPGKFCGTFIPD